MQQLGFSYVSSTWDIMGKIDQFCHIAGRKLVQRRVAFTDWFNSRQF
jgi:hypothetical protein